MSAPWHKPSAGGQQTTKVNGIQVQSSLYGRGIAKGWGTFRVPGNLMWYNAFTSIPHTERQRSGKGGGSRSNTNTTYTYTASIIMSVGQGVIAGIRTVYKDTAALKTDDSGTALSKAGLSLMTGAVAQDPWAYVETKYPDEALGYSGIAYVYAQDYDLGSTGVLSNHSFEVQGTVRVSGKDDANPKDIISDFVQSVPFWASGLINTTFLDDYGKYCLAANLLLSPVIEDQRQASDFLKEILLASNSEVIFSDGKLKIIPYGDSEVSGNGQTWTPDLTPVYDLTLDDFIPGEPGEDSVEEIIQREADSYNYIQVEFSDRTHQYNSNVVPGQDQASIDEFGRRQNKSPYQLKSICDPAIAANVAQLIVQRKSQTRTKYRFRLPASVFGLLEPMDLVTLTTDTLDRVLVRLTSVDEAEGDQGVVDELECEAEEMLIGTAAAADYSRQTTGGYTPNPDVPPGPVTDAALICPPRTLTNGDYEVWVAAAGDNDNWGGCQVWVSVDETEYEQVGTITAAARIGELMEELPSHVDPDTTNTLKVDLGASQQLLLPASDADFNNAVTLSLIDQELIAYRDAELTGPYKFDLDHLRRGLYATAPATHAEGAVFIRLDDALAHIPYRAEQVGSTLYVKLVSFNILGRALEDIENVEVREIVLNPGAAPVIDITSTDTEKVGGVPSDDIITSIQELVLEAAILEEHVAQALAEAIEAQEAAAAAAEEAFATAQELSEKATLFSNQIFENSQAVLQLAMRTLDNQKYFDKLVWEGQTPVKVALQNEIVQRTEGQTTIIETLNTIGVLSEDGSSFILDTSTVKLSPTETMASRFSSINSTFTTQAGQISANSAAISSEATTRANADTVFAGTIALMGAKNGASTAFILDTSTVQIGGGESLGTRFSSIQTSLNNNATAITNEATARSTADTAFANTIALIGAKNGASTAFILDTSTVQIGGGETLATRLSTINTSLGNNSAAITSEATTRANADTAISNTVTALTSTVTTNNTTLTAAISSEATTRANADTAIANTVALIGAKNGSSTAFIIDTSTTQIGGGETLATRLSSIQTSLGNNSSAITSEATTRANADSAFANNFTLLGAKNGAGTAWVFNGGTVIVDGGTGQTLANYISTTQTSLSNAHSAISSEILTRASEDSALASSISTVSSTVAGHTTSITTLTSSVNGISARYGVTINSNGHISGFQILSGVGGSDFIVQVDRFKVVHSDGSSGFVTPFSIDSGVVYLQNVRVYGNLTVDGTLTASKIESNGVTYADGDSASGTTYGNNFDQLIFDKYIWLTYDAEVIVLGQVNFQDGGGHSASSHSSRVKIYVNGSLVAQNGQDGAFATTAFTALGKTTAPGAGGQTLHVEMYANCRDFDYYTDRSLVILRTYR